MTEPVIESVTEPVTGQVAGQLTDASLATHPGLAQADLPASASIWTVLKDQRKTIVVALALAVASFWIVGQLGKWEMAACLAAGVGLGLVNHLATERWLLGIITGGETVSRAAMVRATMVRLVVLAVVAVGLAVWLWPDGIAVLLGLAIFRLIALLMTSITLLKELKEQ